MSPDPNFASRLRKLREDRGLTKTTLGNLLGVSVTCICRWESGGEPFPENLAKLSQVFQISPRVLLCGSEEPDVQVQQPNSEEIEVAHLSRMIAREARKRGWQRRRMA